MADDRMAALELLRKAAGDGDLDFLKKGVAVLALLSVAAAHQTAAVRRAISPAADGQFGGRQSSGARLRPRVSPVCSWGAPLGRVSGRTGVAGCQTSAESPRAFLGRTL